MNLPPIGELQKPPVIERHLLAPHGERQFLSLDFVGPLQVALAQLQAFRIVDGREIRAVLRGARRVVVVSGPGNDYRFALREQREAAELRRGIAQGESQRGREGRGRKGRAVPLERLKPEASVEGKIPLLGNGPERAR